MDFSQNQIIDTYGKEISCILQVTQRAPELSGRGVIMAVLDSGIDIFSPEFQTLEGNTRIIGLWDQSLQPRKAQDAPPPGYAEGVFYSAAQIQEAITTAREKSLQEGRQIVPHLDTSGHGTAVTAIAAGSNIGVAKEAQLLIVKLGTPLTDSFPRTTQLMRGIDYAVKTGVALNQPVAINLSFGNTYGDHRGESLLERFLDNASEIGKTAIVVGSGNEGASNGHTAGKALQQTTIELAVASYETSLGIQLWKQYQDQFRLRILSPGGDVLELDTQSSRLYRQTLEGTQLLCYVAEPLPYSVNQEIYIDMIPQDTYIREGVWRFELTPVAIVTGEYRFYLPSYAARNAGTGFYLPTPEVTLTIPSTAQRAITVGAYDPRQNSYADFSGRGYVYRYEEGRSYLGGQQGPPFGTAFSKPDLTAPGVGIFVPVPGGGYEQVSGTSFAAPYVTGSAALMMEYGIVRGFDPYLYGQKLKAYLLKGAKEIGGFEQYPNDMVGWGALCLRDSLPL